MINRIKYLLFVSLLLFFGEIMGQTIPNLQNINVDDLTSEQIQRFVEQVETSGYSIDQLEVLARARGMSSLQISKLRRRIAEMQEGDIDEEAGVKRYRTMPGDLSTREQIDLDRQSSFDPFSIIYLLDSVSVTDELEIFGLSFFENENFTFEPSLNVATPKNYQVGPGDQIIIDVWGASEQSYVLDVSPEGSITVPNIGPIYLNGLTIERAESRIKQRLKSIYSTLEQNTFAQVNLGQIRSIKVNVVGDVKYPGTYTLSSFASAFNALYVAGGPTETGSLREIKIFRGGQEVTTLDAYDFLIYGKGDNIMLQDQDVILVKPYINRITVDGEIKRPAFYETVEGESLQKVIEFSGGFTENAFKKNISLRRNLQNTRTVKTIGFDSLDLFAIQSGDHINIGRITQQFTGRVRVEGAVNFPGEFEIKAGSMLSDAIQFADGFRGDAFMKRAVILREEDDFNLTTISFIPTEVIDGTYDVPLQAEDLIKVKSLFDLIENYFITVEGEVQVPGNFPYSEGMTVEDIIYLAGGFKESAATSFVEVARRIKNNNDESIVSEIFNFPISEDLSVGPSSSTFVLQPFDLVVVRKSPIYEEQSVVEIEGEVKFPGKYVLTKRDEKISDLLKRAGGLTDFAYADGATLIRRTEFFVDSNDKGETEQSARLRREELLEQFQRDTAIDVTSQTLKRQESIGIELTKILESPGSKFDLILKEGDILSISRELQTVRIRGEVLYPATVRYDNTYGFREFISNAGGFTDEAKKRRAYVIYANGNARRTRSLLGIKIYPAVAPGAEVIVPSKPERQPMPPQAWIALASSTATLALVIQQIITRL